MKYNTDIKLLIEAYGNMERKPTPSTVTVQLVLNAKMVKKIEKLAESDIKSLLEKEINENGEVFIEAMGYDNW